MTARRILTWPDERLLKHASQVEKFDEDLLSLCKDMADTMRAAFGIGLAATQVNVQKSICVLSKSMITSLAPDPLLPDFVVLINPKVQQIGKEKFKWQEGCLSVPDLQEEVTRNNTVLLKYQDLSGKHLEAQLSGIESGTVQHETDHLIGKLFIHRLKGVRRSMTFRKLQKLDKKKKKATALNEDDTLKIGRPKRDRLKNKKKFGKNKKRKK
jgi:peptide deformylase